MCNISEAINKVGDLIKKIISFAMVLVMLASLCSCKQKSNDEEIASLNNENSASGTDKTNKAETNSEESADTSPTTDKSTDITENESDTEIKSENATDDSASEKAESNIIKNASFINAKFNETVYNHKPIKEYFGENSIYHSINLYELTLSENTAEIQYYYPSELDGFYIGKTETAKVYDLPDELKNDEDLLFLAVEMPNGNIELFYKINDRKVGDTLNKVFKVWEHLYGQCMYTSYDSIESISLSGSSNIFDKNKYIIKSKNDIKSLFERICNFEYVTDRYFRTEDKEITEDKYGIYCIYIKFHDGSEFVLNYERISMTLDNYTADEGFEEFLQSLMTEENLVRE